MSTLPRKVFIQVDSTEEQENIKNSRKTLKVLQKDAKDKENLVGRPDTISDKFLFKKSKSETAVICSPSKMKTKRKCSQDSAEKDLQKTIEEDLTTEGEPSDGYWKALAEKRRVALDISLKENEELHGKVNQLEEELNISRAMLEESKNLVEILTEIIQENEANDSGLPNNINNDLSRPYPLNSTMTEDVSDETCDEGAVTDVTNSQGSFDDLEKVENTSE